MRALSYCRVSTSEQAESGLGLEAQRSKILAYASLYGLDLVQEIRDEGESAKSLSRPGIQQALQALRKGEAECLVVARLDRLTRSLKDWQALIEDYFGPDKPYRLMSVADQIDTRSASGRLVLNVLITVGQWERETIAERTKAALQFKKGRNERTGHIPYGMQLASDGKMLRPNPTEQATIELIATLRQEGNSYERIADKLNDLGIPARGKSWHPTTISRLLAR